MSDSHPASDGHLTSDQVAGYLARRMREVDRRRVDAHLAECDECRAEVIEVRSMLRTAPRSRFSTRPILGLVAVAAAAIVLIAIPWRFTSRSQTDLAVPPTTERAMLSDAARDSVPIVAPAMDEVVNSRTLTVTWRRSAKDTRFTVTLMNARGDVRWLGSTRDSTVTLPDSISLAPGTLYIVYVDALRSDGTSTRSGPRSFTIER